jgi:DNA-binding NarL/FixJ family response regulator
MGSSSAAETKTGAESLPVMAARRIRMLVVDRHPITRYGLIRLADSETDICAVGETGSASEALGLVAALRPDVVSLGMLLDDENGMALARELRDRYAGLGLVILTSQVDDAVMFDALDTGVSAVVGKHAPVTEVAAAIRHAAVAPQTFSATGLSAALTRRAETSQQVALSKREHEVLTLLHAGKSVPQIAATLFVSLSTAKTYVARLYEKLGVTNRSQALMTAVRRGLIHLEAEPAA